MKKNKFLMILASSIMLCSGVLTVENTVPTTQVQAARQQARLKRNSQCYNRHGRRISRYIMKKGRKVTVYRTKWIRHKKYYYIGHGRYIKAVNVRIVRVKHVNAKHNNRKYKFNDVGTLYIVKRDCALYNAKGQKLTGNVIKKGRNIYATGTKQVKSGKLIEAGNGIYISEGNLEKDHSLDDILNGGGKNSNSSNANNANANNNSKPLTPNKGNNNSSKTDNDPTSPNNETNHPDYYVTKDGDYNYLTTNPEHVKQLLMDKINAARSQLNVKGRGYKCDPYATNSEIQALANLRVEEATQLFDHTRPNGEYMSANEFQKLLPKTVKVLDTGTFGETLSGVYASETDEETAEGMFEQLMDDPDHRDVLMSTDAVDGYAAVGLHFDKEKGYCVAFEMAGGNGFWTPEGRLVSTPVKF